MYKLIFTLAGRLLSIFKGFGGVLGSVFSFINSGVRAAPEGSSGLDSGATAVTGSEVASGAGSKSVGSGQAAAKISASSLLLIILLCALPLVLLQCSRANLERLREQHSKLEGEYRTLQLRLRECREAASLQDAVLLQREHEQQVIAAKYNKLREEAVRALLPPKEGAIYAEEFTKNNGANPGTKKTAPLLPMPAPFDKSASQNVEQNIVQSKANLPEILAGQVQDEKNFQIWAAQPVPKLVPDLLHGLLKQPDATGKVPAASGTVANEYSTAREPKP